MAVGWVNCFLKFGDENLERDLIYVHHEIAKQTTNGKMRPNSMFGEISNWIPREHNKWADKLAGDANEGRIRGKLILFLLPKSFRNLKWIWRQWPIANGTVRGMSMEKAPTAGGYRVPPIGIPVARSLPGEPSARCNSGWDQSRSWPLNFRAVSAWPWL